MNLSNELWCAILSYLPVDDLYNIAQVNKQLNSIVKSDHIWLRHCLNFIGCHYYAVILPKKKKKMNYQEYYKTLMVICSIPPVRGNKHDISQVKFGRENWTEISSLELKRNIWNLVLSYFNVAVGICNDSQLQCYLNNVVCFKRNKIAYPRLHIDESLTTDDIEDNIWDLAYLPFSIWNISDKDDFFDNENVPLSERHKLINLQEFHEKEFKKCGFLTMFQEVNFKKRMMGTTGTYDGSNLIHAAAYIACLYLKPHFASLIQRKSIDISNLYQNINEALTEAFSQYKTEDVDYDDDDIFSEDEDDSYPAIINPPDIEILENDCGLKPINFSKVDKKFYDTMYIKREENKNDIFHLIAHVTKNIVTTDAKAFLKTILHDTAKALDKKLDAKHLGDGVDDFVNHIVSKYHELFCKRSGESVLLEEFTFGCFCCVFSADILIEASEPIMNVITKLLFNYEVQFSKLANYNDCKNHVRRIDITDIVVNDHESEKVRLFITKHHAVVVYEHVHHY